MNYNVDVFKSSYPELQRHIASMNSSYPLDYQRIDQKTEPVIDVLSHFAGSRVLELGSNFGMYSLLMSPLAEKVTALEIDPENVSISNTVRVFFESMGYKFENLMFHLQSAGRIVDHDYDALLLTLVLYHLNDNEIDILIEDAKKKAEKIIIQCRPARIIKVSQGTLKSHVSKTSRFNGLCDIASNIKFLQEVGMKKISVVVSEKMLGNEVFPVLIAER